MSNRELIVAERLMEVIEIIKRRKKFKNKELAQKAGLNASHLGGVLSGDIDFTVSTLQKILDGLGITFDEFLVHLLRFSDVPDERIRRVVKEEVEKLSGPSRN